MAEIDDVLVRGLLREQRPELANLAISYVARGWDNELWRLGDDLAMRIPRTDRAPELLRREHRWLPGIAPRLPLPVPTPLFLGEPSTLFPQPWAVVSWVSGASADREEVEDESSAAILADFLRALHTEVPADAPVNHESGHRHLQGRFKIDADLIEVIGEDRLRELEKIWNEGRSAPVWSGLRVWAHNDLHSANVVTIDGVLAGVIDFGELFPGDPAGDLAAAWILLPVAAICDFFEHYGDVDDATRCRARGIAVGFGAFLTRMGISGQRGIAGGKPGWLQVGRKALDRVLEVC